MKKENVIKSCYSVLGKYTPLEFDCGKLCNGFCCKGGEDLGMLLFPGEEALIDPDIKVVADNSGRKVAVCNGTCDRNKRPLSCRIYPLFPIYDGEKIEASFDVRANCPLTSGGFKISRRFDKAVRRVGKYLLLNDETAALLKELSEELDEYNNLKDILGV